jgi:hypothetical protein
LANSYAPGLFGTSLTLTKINFDHRLGIGIILFYRQGNAYVNPNRTEPNHKFQAPISKQISMTNNQSLKQKRQNIFFNC